MNTTSIETDHYRRDELLSLAVCLRLCATLLRYPDQTVCTALESALPLFGALHLALLGRSQVPLPSLEYMQVSYTALFVANPAGIPAVPYVSCRLEPDGQVYGAATMALRKMMAEEEVEPDRSLGEPEDHVGLVFDFAALLAERSVGTPKKIRELGHLYETYLTPLLPGFAADVARAEPAGFYADATAFCNALIENHTELFPLFTNQSEY